MNDIVIFERSLPLFEAADLREEAAYYRLPTYEDGEVFAVLDWRFVRQSLPDGSKPVGMIVGSQAVFVSGEDFTANEVRAFARQLGWKEE